MASSKNDPSPKRLRAKRDADRERLKAWSIESVDGEYRDGVAYAAIAP
jgi:hypothetical protein